MLNTLIIYTLKIRTLSRIYPVLKPKLNESPSRKWRGVRLQLRNKHDLTFSQPVPGPLWIQGQLDDFQHAVFDRMRPNTG